MKKMLALVLLVATAAQANGLKEAWNTFGKDNRAVSGGKALVAGYLTYAFARHGYEEWKICSESYKQNKEWFKVKKNSYGYYGSRKAEILPRHGVLLVLCGYATYQFLKQVWHDAKHVLDEDEKEEQTS